MQKNSIYKILKNNKLKVAVQVCDRGHLYVPIAPDGHCGVCKNLKLR